MCISDEDLIDPEAGLPDLEAVQKYLNDPEAHRPADSFVPRDPIGRKIGYWMWGTHPLPLLVFPIVGWFVYGWLGIALGLVTGGCCTAMMYFLADRLGGIPFFGG